VIKVLTCTPVADFKLALTFSNGENGVFDAATYLSEKQGSLLEPLKTISYFQRCFIDAGALCWPNGLELSAQRVLELTTVFEPH
jgi:Protein of unknown function (DUF2442)